MEVKRDKEKAKIEQEITKLSAEIEEIKNNKIFKNAFEWRFEFPEVLDDKGNFVGFDVVLGNPPYIRQEELAAFKTHFQATFETYAGTADLYVYFVERGMNILRPGGHFSYILPNKWMRAGYGDKLRQFIKRQRIEGISDFGDLPVFEEATTYPCVFEMSRAEARPTFPAATIDTLAYEGSLSDYIRSNAFSVGVDSLSDSGWTLSNQSVQQLLDKLRAAGTPLGEYVEGKIYRGVLSGLDEAFVIDEATRNEMISADNNSINVIKPYLAGKDIQKYYLIGKKRFLLFFPKGFTNERRNSEDPWLWFSQNYPVISNYLLKFKEKAEMRFDKGDYWWEMRACNYYEEFNKEKIIYLKFQVKPAFTIDTENHVINSAGFMITKPDKFLIGFLNSKIGWFLISNYCTEIKNGCQLIWEYLREIPVLIVKDEKISSKEQIISLVTRILTTKQTDPRADTSALEAEVDTLVYGLYGLGPEEIAIVEGK